MNRYKKTNDIPATKKMLDEFRRESKSDFTSVKMHVKSLDSKVGSLDLKVDSLDLKIDSLDSKIDSNFEKLISLMAELKSDTHRTLAIVEEQNARNKYVFDGYVSLRAETKKDKFEIVERLDILESVTKSPKA